MKIVDIDQVGIGNVHRCVEYQLTDMFLARRRAGRHGQVPPHAPRCRHDGEIKCPAAAWQLRRDGYVALKLFTLPALITIGGICFVRDGAQQCRLPRAVAGIISVANSAMTVDEIHALGMRTRPRRSARRNGCVIRRKSIAFSTQVI